MDWQDEREMSKRQYRAAIAELGMTQAASGRYLGVSESTVHRYLRGTSRIRPSEALLLRSLLHHKETPVVPKWVRPYKLQRKARS